LNEARGWLCLCLSSFSFECDHRSDLAALTMQAARVWYRMRRRQRGAAVGEGTCWTTE
jgi:hypothetical protein